MPVQHVHAYLVHPKKGSDQATPVNGSAVRLEGRLFQLLNEIYQRSEDECDIDIAFTSADDGAQKNECRDLILSYVKQPNLNNGKKIAARLEAFTDGRSGLGLLFLIAGREGNNYKIVVSRFPTDNAIYVDEGRRNLTVEFLERVFMKNKSSYKAVLYKHTSLITGFWKGQAIDRQLNNDIGNLSDYWIMNFLASTFTTTAALGTRRLAGALRGAVKNCALELKQEIVSAATLAGGLAGQRLTINEFMERFGLSGPAKSAITHELKSPRLAEERFSFDLTEFHSIISYRSVDLSNGGTLTAPSSQFDEVFRSEIVDERGGKVRFTTEGEVVDERIRAKN